MPSGRFATNTERSSRNSELNMTRHTFSRASTNDPEDAAPPGLERSCWLRVYKDVAPPALRTRPAAGILALLQPGLHRGASLNSAREVSRALRVSRPVPVSPENSNSPRR